MNELRNSKSDDQLEELLLLTEQMQEELDQKDRTIRELKMQLDESLTLNERLNSENRAGNIQALKNDLRKTKELLQREKEKTHAAEIMTEECQDKLRQAEQERDESLMLTHNNNPRSVVILVDEIMGMFNSVNRYTNGQLIEQLLTAWSGGALDVTRVSNTIPVHIEHPCINIIGGTQTKRVHELLRKGFEENGLLDRILFVLPKSPEISPWINRDDDGEMTSLAAARWERILDKVFALEYDTEAEERMPRVLSMDREAKEYFFSWWNRKVERINRIEDDVEVDSREMKHPVHVARLALIIQVLRYASDESHLQFVDTVSVKAAIRLNDYFEDSYVRIRSFMANDTCEEPPKVLLSLLPDTFDTKTAIAIGKELQGISERTVMNYLKELCHSRLLRKAKAGHYEKIVYESGKYSMNENE